MTARQRACSASRTACQTSSTTPPPLPSSPFPGNTGTPTCPPSCSSCSLAAGRYTSAATRHGAFCSRFSRRASFAAVVVLPEPCKPTSKSSVGPTELNCSGAAPCAPTNRPSGPTSAPSMRAISSCTSFATCWPGRTASTWSAPTARSRTRSTNARVTSKPTSASSRWPRISRNASVTSASESTPRPVRRFRTAVSCSERAVNIGAQSYLRRWRIKRGTGLSPGFDQGDPRHAAPSRPSNGGVYQPDQRSTVDRESRDFPSSDRR